MPILKDLQSLQGLINQCRNQATLDDKDVKKVLSELMYLEMRRNNLEDADLAAAEIFLVDAYHQLVAKMTNKELTAESLRVYAFKEYLLEHKCKLKENFIDINKIQLTMFVLELEKLTNRKLQKYRGVPSAKQLYYLDLDKFVKTMKELLNKDFSPNAFSDKDFDNMIKIYFDMINLTINASDKKKVVPLLNSIFSECWPFLPILQILNTQELRATNELECLAQAILTMVKTLTKEFPDDERNEECATLINKHLNNFPGVTSASLLSGGNSYSVSLTTASQKRIIVRPVFDNTENCKAVHAKARVWLYKIPCFHTFGLSKVQGTDYAIDISHFCPLGNLDNFVPKHFSAVGQNGLRQLNLKEKNDVIKIMEILIKLQAALLRTDIVLPDIKPSNLLVVKVDGEINLFVNDWKTLFFVNGLCCQENPFVPNSYCRIQTTRGYDDGSGFVNDPVLPRGNYIMPTIFQTLLNSMYAIITGTEPDSKLIGNTQSTNLENVKNALLQLRSQVNDEATKVLVNLFVFLHTRAKTISQSEFTVILKSIAELFSRHNIESATISPTIRVGNVMKHEEPQNRQVEEGISSPLTVFNLPTSTPLTFSNNNNNNNNNLDPLQDPFAEQKQIYADIASNKNKEPESMEMDESPKKSSPSKKRPLEDDVKTSSSVLDESPSKKSKSEDNTPTKPLRAGFEKFNLLNTKTKTSKVLFPGQGKGEEEEEDKKKQHGNK